MKKRNILELKPTQMAFGLKEACGKIDELKKLSHKDFKKYLNKNPIKVVLGPDGDAYIVDHHHLAYALLQLDIHKVKIEVIKDFGRKISHQKFFSKMKRDRCVHLFDQLGRGPHSPLYLAPDIRGMADDPYRSLVWTLQHKKVIGTSNERFYEFKWAQFLRKRNLLKDRSEKSFERAVKQAQRLCNSSPAKNLPGFIGKKD